MQIKPKPTSRINLCEEKQQRQQFFAHKNFRKKIGWFWFDLRFYMQEIFWWKKINWFEIILITSSTRLPSEKLIAFFAGFELL